MGRFVGQPVRPAATAEVDSSYTGLGAAANDAISFQFALPADEPAAGKAEQTPTIAAINWRLLKQSFANATSDRIAAAEYFYARLFAVNPGTRSLFPTSMSEQRERMFTALTRLIWSMDSEPACTEMLHQLGRGHRRFGVLEKHSSAFFGALRDMIQHGLGSSWTPEVDTAWRRAVDFFAAGMRAGAAAASDSPAWWIAMIVGHELRSPGIAVLRLNTDKPLPYQAGQYVPVQVSRWPRTWRSYSVGTAPRHGRLLELHVRAVPGGLVSNTLVQHSAVGDSVLLGAADGTMTLAESDRDLLCVAGGTGLAPIKAIIEQAMAADADRDRPRAITLFVGARQHFDLYDLEDLQLMQASYPALRVIPVLSEQPDYQGLTGRLPEVISSQGEFGDTEAYVCGPPAMVRQAVALLGASIPASQIHYDPLP
jgi:NAD(P)H-flavin reductase